MSKSILCAIDINDKEINKNVLETAAKLAKIDDARLDVCTIVPNFGMSIVSTYFADDYEEKMVEDVKGQLKNTVKDILGEDAQQNMRHIVSHGSIYEEIIKISEQANADLIVIGAHKPGLEDYLLGPNSARVVRHSKISVYVVRS